MPLNIGISLGLTAIGSAPAVSTPVHLTGSAGSYISTPDTAAMRIAGNLEWVLRVSVDNWTAGAQRGLMGDWQGNTLLIQSNNMLGFLVFDAATNPSTLVTAAQPFTNGTTYWIKLAYTANNGSGGRSGSFYYAADQTAEPSSWTLLQTVTNTGTSSGIFSATTFDLGSIGNNQQNLAASFYRAIIRNGIAGSVVADFNSSKLGGGSSYVDNVGSNAGTWTVH